MPLLNQSGTSCQTHPVAQLLDKNLGEASRSVWAWYFHALWLNCMVSSAIGSYCQVLWWESRGNGIACNVYKAFRTLLSKKNPKGVHFHATELFVSRGIGTLLSHYMITFEKIYVYVYILGCFYSYKFPYDFFERFFMLFIPSWIPSSTLLSQPWIQSILPLPYSHLSIYSICWLFYVLNHIIYKMR